MKQLRPVVLRACEAGLAASNLNLDANELADEIMIQITPFVSSSLEQEAQKATALSEDQVVQIIITDLKPTGTYYVYIFLKSSIFPDFVVCNSLTTLIYLFNNFSIYLQILYSHTFTFCLLYSSNQSHPGYRQERKC